MHHTTIHAIAMPPLHSATLRRPLTVRQYQRILEKKTSFSSHSLTKSVADLQTSYRNSIHILINITLMLVAGGDTQQWRRRQFCSCNMYLDRNFNLWSLDPGDRSCRGARMNFYHARLLENSANEIWVHSTQNHNDLKIRNQPWSQLGCQVPAPLSGVIHSKYAQTSDTVRKCSRLVFTARKNIATLQLKNISGLLHLI